MNRDIRDKYLGFLEFFCGETFHLFLRKRFTTGIASLALLIPLFAKNSRLGYFFNANNLRIKFAYANLAF